MLQREPQAGNSVYGLSACQRPLSLGWQSGLLRQAITDTEADIIGDDVDLEQAGYAKSIRGEISVQIVVRLQCFRFLSWA